MNYKTDRAEIIKIWHDNAVWLRQEILCEHFWTKKKTPEVSKYFRDNGVDI